MATSILSVSKLEAKKFLDAGHRNVHVVGHCLSAPSTHTGFSSRHGLLFVGALRDDDSPNVDSLLWFINNVLPQLKNACNAKLYVVGDVSAPSLQAIDDPSVIFTGRVENVKRFYDRCRVFIAPTRYAAGIPHKVHEAAAFGLPCVVSTLLLNQLGWIHGNETLSACSAEDFIECCTALYHDEPLWSSVQSNALNAIKKECSPEVFQDGIKRALSSLN
jgi:glycosyltransferase involved in cell wall biosynthesis